MCSALIEEEIPASIAELSPPDLSLPDSGISSQWEETDAVVTINPAFFKATGPFAAGPIGSNKVQ